MLIFSKLWRAKNLKNGAYQGGGKIFPLLHSRIANTTALLLISSLAILYYGGKLKMVLILALIFFFIPWGTCRSTYHQNLPAAFKQFCTYALTTLLILFPFYVGLIQFAYLRGGEQGVDFAIFSQIIHRTALINSPTTSLVGLTWNNLFSHHFSPFLVLLGYVAKTGIPAEYILIFSHVISLICLIYGIYNLIKLLHKDSFISLCLTSTILLLPSVRFCYTWETHDEILALPFIIWSLHAHFRGRNNLRLILLGMTLFFKETLALNIFCLSIGYWISSSIPRERFRCLALATLCLFFFIAYVKILPGWPIFREFVGSASFEGLKRISSFKELLDPLALNGKLTWVGTLLSPCFAFLILNILRYTKNKDLRPVLTCLLILCGAAYNIAAILVTNFPNMYYSFNYYSVTPAILIFLALISAVSGSRHVLTCTMFSVVTLSLIGWRINTRDILNRHLFVEAAYAELEPLLNKTQTIIADDHTASILINHERIIRLFHANHSTPKFDRLVLRKEKVADLNSEVSPELLMRSTHCAETNRFIIRCPV